jgi:hypothetical protein
MKNMRILITNLSIATIIICMVLNFQEFLMGSEATIKNMIVTFSYIAIWIIILVIGIATKNRATMCYCSIFWGITIFVAVVTVYVNATGNLADWVIPLAILFLGQWYGIGFFVSSFLFSSIIIAFISLVMFTITVISLKYIRTV